MATKMILSLCFVMMFLGGLGQTKKDSLKVTELLKAAGNSVYNDIRTAPSKINKGIRFSRNKKSKSWEAKFYNIWGVYYLQKSNADSAEHCYLRAKRLIQGVKHQEKMLAALNNNLSLIERRRGNFELAHTYLDESIVLEERLGNTAGVIESWMNKSIIYEMSGDYVRATRILLDYAKDPILQDSLHRIKTNILVNLGVNFYYLNDLRSASHYFEKAYRLASDKGEIDQQLLSLDNCIEVRLSLDSLEGIPFLISNYIELAEKQGYPFYQIQSKRRFAEYLIKIGEIDSAEISINQALKTGLEYFQPLELYSLYGLLGNVKFEKQNYPLALEYFLKALEYGTIVKDYGYTVGLYLKMATCYEKMGNIKQAYAYQSLFFELKDSINIADQGKVAQRLEIEFETELLRKDILLKNAGLKSERNAKIVEQEKFRKAIWLSVSLVALLLLLVLFFLREKQRRKLLAERNGIIQEHQNQFYKSQNRKLQATNMDSKRHIIEIGQILYLQKATGADYVEIYATDGMRYTYFSSISELLKNELKESFFVQVNRSTLVNLHHILALNESSLTLNFRKYDPDNKKVLISRKEIVFFKKEAARALIAQKYAEFTAENA